MKNLSKNMTLAAALTLAMTALCGSAMAQDAVAAPAAAEAVPDNVVSYNVALTSDYRYRGMSQSRLKPAISGGADYTHNPTGLYVGTWLSSIKWIKDGGGDTNLEWDIYGGKRGEISKDFTYDVGGLYYFYPSNGLSTNANTFELYGQLGYGPAYIKYSHSTTNLFGVADSKNSGYLDVGANIRYVRRLSAEPACGPPERRAQRFPQLHRLQDRRHQGFRHGDRLAGRSSKPTSRRWRRMARIWRNPVSC